MVVWPWLLKDLKMFSSGTTQTENKVLVLWFGKFQYIVDYNSKRLKEWVITWVSSVCLFCGYSNTGFRLTWWKKPSAYLTSAWHSTWARRGWGTTLLHCSPHSAADPVVMSWQAKGGDSSLPCCGATKQRNGGVLRLRTIMCLGWLSLCTSLCWQLCVK